MSTAIMAVKAKKPMDTQVCTVCCLMNPRSSTPTATKMNTSASVKRASTKSRVKDFAGPWSRRGL